IVNHCANGYYNTAINRMYYACYYAASALLIAYEIETKSHDGVRQMLGKYFVLTGKMPMELGKFYSIMFNKRSSGDYEDFINHTQSTVDQLYPKAEEFISFINSYLTENSLYYMNSGE
ncbi:MAG: HEPN domain-containing protein, partial [Bacteroides sp.]